MPEIAARIPGWARFLLLVALLYPLAPAADLTQYLNAGTHWPDIYHVPFEPGTGGGYYGIFLPWTVPLLLPLSWLPLPLATALVRALTVMALHLLAGRALWKSAAVLLSFPGFLLVWQGNLDALSALGALLPGGGALLLLAMKPQAAFLAALPILQRDGWRHLLGPALVIALSTLLWPEWLYRVSFAGKGFGWWNWSLFPWSLPLVAFLLYRAWRQRDPLLAAVISPLAAPFLLPYSAAPALALLFRRWPRLGWALWLLTWVAGLGFLLLSLSGER